MRKVIKKGFSEPLNNIKLPLVLAKLNLKGSSVYQVLKANKKDHSQDVNPMKKITITLCLITASFAVSATTFYEQLCAFNFNWKKYSMIAPKGEARTFRTDAEYVQAHLSCVIPILRNNPASELTGEQQSTRNSLIALLDEYRCAGRFPLNHYRTERIPVFIDEHGTHCAVGYLMMMSGHDDLARRISRTDNYVWVKDIKDPEALAWQQYSGFTSEELKLIQGAYDWYDEQAWYSPDKYETPQMPTCTTAYFDNSRTTIGMTKEEKIWCKGEGDGKVLNGKWEQYTSPGVPWLKGNFTNGKRSGHWEEYYKGTKLLCRCEEWRNNKLNGVRKRFDYAGNITEEILFAEGNAVCKINYDLTDSLAYVRVPQDSLTVATQVYNSSGKLIACGKETIYNPGGLLWFQNIELTAMNSIQVGTRANALASGVNDNGGLNSQGGYTTGRNGGEISLYPGGFDRYNYQQPSLVEYHKTGTWMFYPFRSKRYEQFANSNRIWYMEFGEMGEQLYTGTYLFRDQLAKVKYDSIKAEFTNNQIDHFYGYRQKMVSTHLYFTYHPTTGGIVQYIFGGDYESHRPIKSAGQYSAKGERIGEWKYFNEYGQPTKTENYLIPMKEEEVSGERKEYALK